MSTYAIKAEKFVLPGVVAGPGYLSVTDGVFGAYSDAAPEGVDVLDLSGKWVAPGFVDTHIHGFYNHATTDRSAEGINASSVELARRGTGKTVYILDEPTTGLHIADVHRLIEVLQKLVDVGNTVIVIEHNLDLIKCADHIIDLGPEGGSAGGEIVAEGTPEQVAAVPGSFTGQYLRPLLERDRAQRAAEAEKH